jgi:hypothetical protein
MTNLPKYLIAMVSGYAGAYSGRYVGAEWGTFIGGTVASALSIVAARLLHNTPAPTK